MEVVLGEAAGVAGEEVPTAAGVEEAGVLVEDEVDLEDTETRVLLLKLWVSAFLHLGSSDLMSLLVGCANVMYFMHFLLHLAESKRPAFLFSTINVQKFQHFSMPVREKR